MLSAKEAYHLTCPNNFVTDISEMLLHICILCHKDYIAPNKRYRSREIVLHIQGRLVVSFVGGAGIGGQCEHEKWPQ